MAVTAPVQVEAMRADDIPAVHEIERLSFANPWPAHAFEQELTGNRLARYVVARAGRRVVAFAGIWQMVDEAHITTFGVHPDWRRRGVGSQLLLAVVELARQVGARRLTLEVRAGNLPAQALYESFGFEVRGRRVRYYTDDGEDALVMTTPDLDSPTQAALIEALRRRLGEPGAAGREAER
jgi:ribosomal-protein-alanine N-acetyltransferase